MKVIKPKTTDILSHLYNEGCIYVGGTGCGYDCYDAKFFESCYNKKKKFLTQTFLTKEEIEQESERTQKAWREIYKRIERKNNESN